MIRSIVTGRDDASCPRQRARRHQHRRLAPKHTTCRIAPFQGNRAEQKWDGASAFRNIGHDVPAVKKTDRNEGLIIGLITTGRTPIFSCNDYAYCHADKIIGQFALPCAGSFLDQIPSGFEPLFAVNGSSQEFTYLITQHARKMAPRVRICARRAG